MVVKRGSTVYRVTTLNQAALECDEAKMLTENLVKRKHMVHEESFAQQNSGSVHKTQLSGGVAHRILLSLR